MLFKITFLYVESYLKRTFNYIDHDILSDRNKFENYLLTVIKACFDKDILTSININNTSKTIFLTLDSNLVNNYINLNNESELNDPHLNDPHLNEPHLNESELNHNSCHQFIDIIQYIEHVMPFTIKNLEAKALGWETPSNPNEWVIVDPLKPPTQHFDVKIYLQKIEIIN